MLSPESSTLEDMHMDYIGTVDADGRCNVLIINRRHVITSEAVAIAVAQSDSSLSLQAQLERGEISPEGHGEWLKAELRKRFNELAEPFIDEYRAMRKADRELEAVLPA